MLILSTVAIITLKVLYVIFSYVKGVLSTSSRLYSEQVAVSGGCSYLCMAGWTIGRCCMYVESPLGAMATVTPSELWLHLLKVRAIQGFAGLRSQPSVICHHSTTLLRSRASNSFVCKASLWLKIYELKLVALTFNSQWWSRGQGT